MNAVLQEQLAGLADEVAGDVTLDYHIDENLPPVLGHADQLGQVVRYLCERARRSMEGSGGTFTVTAQHRPLTDEERETLVNVSASSYICMSFHDTGHGMSDEMRAHIFDPFYLSRTTRDGPGLDMPIVYGVISNHLGDITLESEEGQGTTFRVYLPVQERAAGESVTDEAALGGTETVLVVDDEMMVREMIQWILDARGYRVLTASSGEEALKIFREEEGAVDLVLLDIIMPGMGGEEAFQAIRAIDSEARVLLTSVHSQETLGERLTKQGARGIIYKPYRSAGLLAAVRKALD